MKNVKMLFASALMLGSSVLGANAVMAHDYYVGELEVTHPWARPLPPISRVGAAYFTVINKGDKDDVLLSAESPVAEKVEIHNTFKEGDMLQMRPQDGLIIPAHGEQKLAPGGVHLMLIDLKEERPAGTRFPVTLHFKEAGKLDIEVAIDADTDNRDGDHDGGGHH